MTWLLGLGRIIFSLNLALLGWLALVRLLVYLLALVLFYVRDYIVIACFLWIFKFMAYFLVISLYRPIKCFLFAVIIRVINSLLWLCLARFKCDVDKTLICYLVQKGREPEVTKGFGLQVKVTGRFVWTVTCWFRVGATGLLSMVSVSNIYRLVTVLGNHDWRDWVVGRLYCAVAEFMGRLFTSCDYSLLPQTFGRKYGLQLRGCLDF